MLLSTIQPPPSLRNKNQSSPKRRRRWLFPRSPNIKRLNLKLKSREMMAKCTSILRMTRKIMKAGIPTTAHRLQKNLQKSLQRLNLRFRVKRLSKCWWMPWNLSPRQVKERNLRSSRPLALQKRLKRRIKLILMQSSHQRPRNLLAKPWDPRKRQRVWKNQKIQWLDFSILTVKVLIYRLLRTATCSTCNSNMQNNHIWRQWKSFKSCMHLRPFRSSGRKSMLRSNSIAW